MLEGEDTQYIGEVAEKYLKKFATKDEADRTYGLYDKGGKFYIGKKLLRINSDLFSIATFYTVVLITGMYKAK